MIICEECHDQLPCTRKKFEQDFPRKMADICTVCNESKVCISCRGMQRPDEGHPDPDHCQECGNFLVGGMDEDSAGHVIVPPCLWCSHQARALIQSQQRELISA